jgi:hypothetical protein
MDAFAFALLPSLFILVIGVPVVAYLLGRFDHSKQRKGWE